MAYVSYQVILEVVCINKIDTIRVRIYCLHTGPYYTAVYYSEHWLAFIYMTTTLGMAQLFPSGGTKIFQVSAGSDPARFVQSSHGVVRLGEFHEGEGLKLSCKGHLDAGRRIIVQVRKLNFCYTSNLEDQCFTKSYEPIIRIALSNGNSIANLPWNLGYSTNSTSSHSRSTTSRVKVSLHI
jgi:hypothetical protein